MGYTSNQSKQSMWIIGYGWWWFFGRQKQVHIVCSNCSEEPISPLHRGINISSTSIESQEVNIALKLTIPRGWSITHQSTVPDSLSHKRNFRRLPRVQLGGVGVQGGELGGTSCSKFSHPWLWLKGKRSSDRGDLQGWHGSSLYQVETKILARYLGSPVETLHSPSIRNTRAKIQVVQGQTSLEAQKRLVENEQINKDAYKLIH